ncbi:MAG: hypothetical protein OQL16_08595 [Gammaproteobacteria bacterium]|nr:hypothetical protein [Gammaproteobacteria bacterium]
MRRSRRDLQVFNLSFLDVVSCGFGAVIMLVLVSHTSDFRADLDNSGAADLLKSLFESETRVSDKARQLEELRQELSAARVRTNSLKDIQQQLQRKAAADKTKIAQISDDIRGLELVQSSLDRASISLDTANKRDNMSGGIPVDSDYVIFIIDTSGSMKQIWRRVISVLRDVLDIHPRVKGFQVLSDNGAYLLPGYAKKWITDTRSTRDNVLKLLTGWNAASNSSPVEGLEAALKTYARSGKNISIYIFGDDYTGSSYGPVLDTLDRLNRDRNTGKPLVKVHAIGFITSLSTNRFGILMREVTKRNRGTFLALPVR